ncbi:uncharacterized protein LOC142494317 [Ascaphus truei]|uniref:uncharacterized protein LOC142494317 n=1 Tax=Ascaphus truei TaxID=8439 RepID=UPI003F595126
MSQLFALRANRNIDIDKIFSEDDSPIEIEEVPDNMYDLVERIFKPSTTDFQSDEFLLEWNRILDNCSFELIRLLISKRKILLQSLDEEINELKGQFEVFKNHSELPALENKIKTRMDTFQKETISRKQVKFQRDRIDYKTGCYRNWKKTSKDNAKYRHPKANTPKDYSHKIPNHYRKVIPSNKEYTPKPVQFMSPKPKRGDRRIKANQSNKPDTPVVQLDKEIDCIFEQYHQSNRYQPLVEFEQEQNSSTQTREDKPTFSFLDWRKTREQQNAREAIKDLLGKEGTSRDRKRKNTLEEREEAERIGKQLRR